MQRRNVLSGHNNCTRRFAMKLNGIEVVPVSQDRTLRLWTLEDRVWNSTVIQGLTGDVECTSVHPERTQVLL